MSNPHWPSEQPTYGNLHVGDVHDDDASIIDKNFQEVDTPPTYVPQHIITPVLTQPTPCTRLLTVTLPCDPAWGTVAGTSRAVELLPADAHRKALKLRVLSPTAVTADYVRIADDPGKLETANGGAPLYHLDNIDIDEHTGPLYVTANGASAITNITAIAVTS